MYTSESRKPVLKTFTKSSTNYKLNLQLIIVNSQICECEDSNTEVCHPWTGQCSCKIGWDGRTCIRPCPSYTFGKGCQNHCNCKNNALCSPIDGACICAAGYRGKDCDELCAGGTFGENCAQKCACKNGARCSSENGSCNCTAGEHNCAQIRRSHSR